MAFVIGNDCVSFVTCKEHCPAEAVFVGDGTFEIDPEKCVSCGTCAENCPVKAIKNDEE